MQQGQVEESIGEERSQHKEEMEQKETHSEEPSAAGGAALCDACFATAVLSESGLWQQQMPLVRCIPLLPLVAALVLVPRGELLLLLPLLLLPLLRGGTVLLLQWRRQLLGRGRRTLCIADAKAASILLLWSLLGLLGLAGWQACCWLCWRRCPWGSRRSPAAGGDSRCGLHAPNLELLLEEIRMHPARLLIQLCLQAAHRQADRQAGTRYACWLPWPDYVQASQGKDSGLARCKWSPDRQPCCALTENRLQTDPHHQPTLPTCSSRRAHTLHMSSRGGASCSASGRFNRSAG